MGEIAHVRVPVGAHQCRLRGRATPILLVRSSFGGGIAIYRAAATAAVRTNRARLRQLRAHCRRRSLARR
jgi:hypothetical protein